MSLYTFLPLLNLWAQKDQFTLKIYLNVHFSSLSVTIILVIIQYVLNAHYVLEKKGEKGNVAGSKKKNGGLRRRRSERSEWAETKRETWGEDIRLDKEVLWIFFKALNLVLRDMGGSSNDFSQGNKVINLHLIYRNHSVQIPFSYMV